MTHTEIRSLGITLDPASTRLADGSRWSHAATMGTFWYRGKQVVLDADYLRALVTTFASGGYPQKPIVDYDHGSVRADGSGNSPKAGDIQELRVVLSAADLPPTAVEQIARAGRTADDARNFGLWMRWTPNDVAEQRVQRREYTDLSITFADSCTNPRTGSAQGPTLFSVALTNTPHLDTMVPIAAARGEGAQPAASTSPDHERSAMEKNTLLTRMSVALGRVIGTEEEAASAAESRITSLTREVESLQGVKTFAAAVLAEVGETDTTKALGSIKELKVKVATAESAAREAKKLELTAKRDAIIKKFEDRFVPAEKQYLEISLMTDLEAGRDGIEKMLGARPKLAILSRSSGADEGKNRPVGEAALDDKVKAFMRDEKLDYATALEKAEAEIADEQRVASTTNG